MLVGRPAVVEASPVLLFVKGQFPDFQDRVSLRSIAEGCFSNPKSVLVTQLNMKLGCVFSSAPVYYRGAHCVCILKGSLSFFFLASDGEGMKLQKQTSSNMVLVLL